ncbi:hypothetical protein HanXRQr2_Chr14g0653831 [Helianthus annuus]|uniref:Uncharacterized protein n=1 Tax=Helianthus annuus TaxID=4232 RepID=A0A9K3EBN6_HELAN|nr:hypothetical protein HanXRQr2_Chr14g0653831 [Helianthus annuus]
MLMLMMMRGFVFDLEVVAEQGWAAEQGWSGGSCEDGGGDC